MRLLKRLFERNMGLLIVMVIKKLFFSEFFRFDLLVYENV